MDKTAAILIERLDAELPNWSILTKKCWIFGYFVQEARYLLLSESGHPAFCFDFTARANFRQKKLFETNVAYLDWTEAVADPFHKGCHRGPGSGFRPSCRNCFYCSQFWPFWPSRAGRPWRRNWWTDCGRWFALKTCLTMRLYPSWYETHGRTALYRTANWL